MYIQNDKAEWNILRFDYRTFTSRLAKMREDKQALGIPEKYIFIDDYCFKGDKKIKEAILPSDCRIIGKEAFAYCQFRNPVIFSNVLEEIKEGAFSENYALQSVLFPASLRELGAFCYGNCKNLKTVEFEKKSNCVRIPEGCFYSCTRLNRVIFSSKIKIIQKKAFYRCKELRNMELPIALKKIGEEAFYFCGIEEMELPFNLQEIADRAFFGCKNLKSVYIPEHVNFIGTEAFHGCNRLEYLEIDHDPAYIGTRIVNKNCTVRCKKGSKVDRYCEEQGLKREYI